MASQHHFNSTPNREQLKERKTWVENPTLNQLELLILHINGVRKEAARQQVPHAGGFGKVAPAPQMPPAVMQRHLGGVVPNQPQQGFIPMVGGPVGSSNIIMEQWGSRYPTNTTQPILRPPNQNPVMPQNAMQQQNINMGMVVGPSNQMVGGMNVAGGMRPTGGQASASTANGPQLNTQQLSQIMQKVKNNPSSEGHHQILQMLKSNPQIMAAIIKQRQLVQNAGRRVGGFKSRL